MPQEGTCCLQYLSGSGPCGSSPRVSPERFQWASRRAAPSVFQLLYSSRTEFPPGQGISVLASGRVSVKAQRGGVSTECNGICERGSSEPPQARDRVRKGPGCSSASDCTAGPNRAELRGEACRRHSFGGLVSRDKALTVLDASVYLLDSFICKCQ